MNRRAFITGLVAAPFVYKTGLLATSQVLLRPEYGLSPALLTGPDLRRIALLERAYAEAINRMVYPALVVRPDGNIDQIATQRLSSANAERASEIYHLLMEFKP